MSAPSLLQATKIALVLLWFICPAGAAETRPWITLTNCEYVPNTNNDGDSFYVRAGTNQFIVRLYFVDAPEANLRYPERTHEQAVHFGATIDETMKAGVRAKDAVQKLLQRPFVVRTRWASAAGRSKQPRYYGLVEVGGTNLAEVLVSQGLARTKGVVANLPSGEKSKAYVPKLESLEAEAKQKRRGLWAAAPEKEPAAASPITK